MPSTLRRLALTTTATVALAAPAFADDAESTISELVITADRGFAAQTVQVGAFRNARVIDTPLTVNVISREVLDAQGALTLHDALRNTAGVTRSQLNGATYDNIAIRGILVENRGNYRLNGALPVINLIDQPLENKARVEVLKGASALYYGFVPPSGVINMTTKRAERSADPVAEVTLRGDDHGTILASTDLSNRFFDGTLGVRANLAGGHLDAGIDRAKGDRGLAALALDYDPTDRLSLKLDYEFIDKDIVEPAAIALLPAIGGVITLPAVPDPTLNLADDWQHYDAQARNALGRIDYRLTDRWAIKVEAGRAETKRDRAFSQFQTYNLTTGEGTLRIFQTRGQRYINRNLRTELSGVFETGPVRHEITFGYTYNEREQNGRQSVSYDAAQNLFTPRPVVERPLTAPLTQSPSIIFDQGTYVFDRMSWGPIQAVAGLRYGAYKSKSATARYTANELTPALAVIYKPREWISLYATYLEGLEEGGIAPANTVNAFEVLPPAKSKQWEAGAKAEVGDSVVASIAYFEITRPSAFTTPHNRFVLDGETDYRGVEFTAAGELTDRLSLIASGIWLDASLERAANAALTGMRPDNTAKWTGSVFADWRLPFAEGFSVNGGLFYVGKRPVNPLNQAFIDGYVTATLGAKLEREIAGRRTGFQINVENLIDKAYWSTAGNNLLGVGAPRTVKFQITRAL